MMQGTRLELSQRQELTITPMMQQAIAILLMSALELEQHVQQELETNPTLETEDPSTSLESQEGGDEDRGDDSGAPDGDEAGGEQADFEAPAPDGVETASSSSTPDSTPPGDDSLSTGPDELDFANLFSSAEPRGTGGGEETENAIEQTSSEAVPLSDHLLEQLRLAAPPPAIEAAARLVISRLDDNGYLGMNVADFASTHGLDPAEAETAVKLVQGFEPPGVAAADIRECLLIQLRLQGLETSLAHRILESHFEDLSKNRLPAIARALGAPMADVSAAIDFIRTLEPRPGRSFGASDTNYVVPDVIVEKVNGEYIVSLRNDRIPTIRVSDYYLRMYEREKRKKGEVSEYLKSKLESAFWLIKSIQQRQNTLYRVSESIVKHQVDFLEYGPKHLRPMTLRVIADDVGVHESTVSRVTTNKYIQTPRGTFELKYFFTSPIETASGEDASSRSVKTILSEIIANEDPKNPHSDQKLTEMMAARGFSIARRTVTKYREQLGILSAKQRMKY